MSITIIECTAGSITLTNFSKKNFELCIEYESIQVLKSIQEPEIRSNWISEASQAIQELVAEAKTIFPTIVILPGFASLTKVIQVPKVTPRKQKEVIHTHVHNLLGTGKEEYLAYAIAKLEEYKLDTICVLVKKHWIESFCKAIEPIGIQILSIEPPSIHYYNAYKKAFPGNDESALLIIIQSSLAYCLFLNKCYTSFHQIDIQTHSFFEEIKQLIDHHSKRNSKNYPKEILISRQHIDNENFIDALKKIVKLPAKLFTPPNSEPSHLLGSVGAASRILFTKGLSIDLIPSNIKTIWTFNRYKKAILFASACITASLLILLNNINHQIKYYEEKCLLFETKIQPLKNSAAIINHNEKSIAFYNEGLKALESYIASSRSWIHFLNAFQNSLMAIPHVHIHSLQIVEPEYKLHSNWKNEFMGTQIIEIPSQQPRLIQITGSFLIDTSRPEHDAIDQINLLMSELTKLEFIEATTNLYFETQYLPTVPFSFSLALKPNTF